MSHQPRGRLDIEAIRARMRWVDESMAGKEWRVEQIGEGWSLQRLSQGEHADEREWVPLWWIDRRNNAPVTSRDVASFVTAARTDVPQLCARVLALERALRDVLKWLPADSRGAKQIRAALDGGEP